MDARGMTALHPDAVPPTLCQSCDTLVVLPAATSENAMIFGKNSDRPATEVQEVVYFPGQQYEPGTKLKCTYIEIDQADQTLAVVLSKPAWMWGAEMGANELGVCIGNEAVWTREPLCRTWESISLLGMDLLRLGLERGKTAAEALKVITSLLEQYGQGGPCQEGEDPETGFTYHNSFLIVDHAEAWVLETAGKSWAAHKIKNDICNISNNLTIQSDIDEMSKGLKEYAQERGYWDPQRDGEFNFSKAFADGDDYNHRQISGKFLLKKHKGNGDFRIESMMTILRDHYSGICMHSGSTSMGSMVSQLDPNRDDPQDVHWFTATPYPCHSIFKPFMFRADTKDTSPSTVSPNTEGGSRQHELFQLHGGKVKDEKFLKKMADKEKSFIRNIKSKKGLTFAEAVRSELALYSEAA